MAGMVKGARRGFKITHPALTSPEQELPNSGKVKQVLPLAILYRAPPMTHNNPPTTLDYLTTWESPVGWFPYQVDAEHEAQLSGPTYQSARDSHKGLSLFLMFPYLVQWTTSGPQ